MITINSSSGLSAIARCHCSWSARRSMPTNNSPFVRKVSRTSMRSGAVRPSPTSPTRRRYLAWIRASCLKPGDFYAERHGVRLPGRPGSDSRRALRKPARKRDTKTEHEMPDGIMRSAPCRMRQDHPGDLASLESCLAAMLWVAALSAAQWSDRHGCQPTGTRKESLEKGYAVVPLDVEAAPRWERASPEHVPTELREVP